MFTVFPAAVPAARSARRPLRIRHGVAALALALLAGVAGHGAQAQQALSFDAALRAAEARSQQLVGQDAAAHAARAMATAAGQLPDPVLKAGLNNVPINGDDRFSLTRDFMTERSIAVAQEFTRADKRQARSARFEREAQVAEAGRVMALAALRRDTATAWLDRYYQARIHDLLQTQRGELRLQVEAANAAYRGGRGTQADVFAARSALAQLDERLIAQEREIATAQTRLARWVGTAAPTPSKALPPMDSLRLDAVQLEAQIDAHPQIALMAQREAVARADADIAQSEKRSDWSVELMYSKRGPAYADMVSVNFSIPLQLDQKNRQEQTLAAKLATADQLEAERLEATRASTAEALAWLQQWQGNRKRLALYDSTLVPLAAQRTQAELAAYRGGTTSLDAALAARRKEIDVKVEQLRLAMETAALWARLEFLIPTDASTPIAQRAVAMNPTHEAQP